MRHYFEDISFPFIIIIFNLKNFVHKDLIVPLPMCRLSLVIKVGLDSAICLWNFALLSRVLHSAVLSEYVHCKNVIDCFLKDTFSV